MFLLPQSTGYWLQDEAEVRSYDWNQRTQSPFFEKRLDSYSNSVLVSVSIRYRA
jgi:hypothetical protein